MQIIISKKEFLAGSAASLKIRLLIQELGGRAPVRVEAFEDVVSCAPSKGVIILNDGVSITISLNEDMVVDSIALAAKLALPYVKLAASAKLALALFRTEAAALAKKIKKFQKKWN